MTTEDRTPSPTTPEGFREYLEAKHDEFSPQDPDRETTGQARMAYRLTQRYTGRLIHVHGLGWHTWTGKRWEEDKRGAATRAVLDVLRRSWREAMGDDKLLKDVKACNSAAGVAGVLKLAAGLPEFSHTVDDLDQDPYLLNVANGTLDLRTMELKAHDPADKLTKVTAGAWRPHEAGTGAWATFLDEVLPDEAVAGFLQRYVGQALVGQVLEHRLAILTGTGGNGKGVWYGAVDFALGDYAITPKPDMLLAAGNRGTFDGSVELRAARWAVFSEIDDGKALAPATVKRLTGGDRIAARNLYQPLIEFDPTHTLAMVVNHLPEVPDMSRGMWRRLLVVPFDQEIPEDRMDDQLPSKLQAAADEVLTWAIRGWQAYEANGRHLNPPEAVQAATGAFKAQADQLAQFVDDVTEPRHGADELTSTQLWNAYGQWLARTGERAQVEGRNKLAEQLRDRLEWRMNSKKRWLGHVMRPEWLGAGNDL